MSLSSLLNPEMPLSVAAAVTAEYVFDRETKNISYSEGSLVQWESAHGFQEPLRAAHYSDKEMSYYSFVIDGELSDELTIFPYRTQTHVESQPTLAQDDFADYFFERFAGLFDGHIHTICLRALRLGSQQKLREPAQRKEQERQNSMADGLPIRVSNKRKIS